MGYALKMWAAPVDDLSSFLEHRHADADAVEVWLNDNGRCIDIVDHMSSAVGWFRDEVIGGVVAARFGAELAGHLLDRPLGGSEWDGGPSVGWVRNAELRAAVPSDARNEAPDPESDEDEILQTITGVLVRVLDSGQDLVTCYS